MHVCLPIVFIQVSEREKCPCILLPTMLYKCDSTCKKRQTNAWLGLVYTLSLLSHLVLTNSSSYVKRRVENSMGDFHLNIMLDKVIV